MTLADTYDNIAKFKSLAPDLWSRLLSKVNLKGSFAIFGAGDDNVENAKAIIDDIYPLMYLEEDMDK